MSGLLCGGTEIVTLCVLPTALQTHFIALMVTRVYSRDLWNKLETFDADGDDEGQTYWINARVVVLVEAIRVRGMQHRRTSDTPTGMLSPTEQASQKAFVQNSLKMISSSRALI